MIKLSVWMVIQKKTMKEVAASLLILLVDTALWVVLWGGLVLLRCSSCGGLAGLWAFGAAKWAALHTFTSIVTDGRTRQVLRRLVALLCLLPAVTESGRMLLTPPSEPFTEPPPDLSVVLVGSLSSSLACWMWEKGIVGDGNHNHKQEARRVLIRMLMYFRPDIFHLIAAFSFLILCVLCECETVQTWFHHHLFPVNMPVSHSSQAVKTLQEQEMNHPPIADIPISVYKKDNELFLVRIMEHSSVLCSQRLIHLSSQVTRPSLFTRGRSSTCWGVMCFMRTSVLWLDNGRSSTLGGNVSRNVSV